MRQPGREFGDGFFNGVLIEFLSESDLSQQPVIAKVLKHISANRPRRDGKRLNSYDVCKEMIENAIRGRAHELKGQLDYPEDDAKAILVRALARYLDERFSVSSRRRLGFLRA